MQLCIILIQKWISKQVYNIFKFEVYSFQGLELEYEHNKQMYLTFKSTEIRDSLYNNLLNQSKVKMENHERCIMTLKWQNGALSNYDYLLYLNRY